jgi:hypothetical protein
MNAPAPAPPPYGLGCLRRSRPSMNHPHAPSTGTHTTITVHTSFAGLPCRVPNQIDPSALTPNTIHADANQSGHVVLPASIECAGGT